MWCRYIGWNGRKYFFSRFLFGILKFLYICKKNTRMNLETFERYAENWIDRDVRAAINQSDLGCIGLIIDPLRLSKEINYYHKKYKDECILFLRNRWGWTETGEEVEINDFFIETHLELEITLKQLIKKTAGRKNSIFIHGLRLQ